MDLALAAILLLAPLVRHFLEERRFDDDVELVDIHGVNAILKPLILGLVPLDRFLVLAPFVGVAGVLAFSVSARTHEFGVRLAVGLSPRRLLMRVLFEGASIVAIGIAAGAVGAFAFAGVAASYLENMRVPGAMTILAAAFVLVGAAIVASLLPAARASRVDVLQALRTE